MRIVFLKEDENINDYKLMMEQNIGEYAKTAIQELFIRLSEDGKTVKEIEFFSDYHKKFKFHKTNKGYELE
jgi:hypothetical protein